MNDPGQRHDVSNPTISAAIARVRAQGAESSTDAVLVGNRAGIVEWTNAAWSQTTGFPQHETIQKPISHFLDVSGIELELVDFVGRHFIEGRRCTIEFPFETFDDREIQVHLEVESIRNEAGEIDAFIATANVMPAHESRQEIEHEKNARPAVIARERSPHESARRAIDADTEATRGRLGLSQMMQRVCRAAATRCDTRVHFDVSLAADDVGLALPAESLLALGEALVTASLAGIADEWGCITVLTGRAPAQRGHVSQAHPVIARPLELASGPHQLIEVHDTGACLSLEALERIRSGLPGACAREIALVRAQRYAHSLGASLHIDATPGCGQQSLVLFPIDETRD